MAFEVPKPNTPQWMLRRFAGRCRRIFARHKDRALVVAAHEFTLMRSAEEFIRLYDIGNAGESIRIKEYAEGKTAIADLLKKMRAWVALVANAIPSIKPAEYGERPDVPSDVISDAELLLEIVSDENHRKDLPFADLLEQDLKAALARAHAEWAEAETAGVDKQTLRTQTRQAAREFEKDLVAFRTTLKAVLGRGHPDFQKLRRRRVKARDEDDDQHVPEPPEDDFDDDALEDED